MKVYIVMYADNNKELDAIPFENKKDALRYVQKEIEKLKEHAAQNNVIFKTEEKNETIFYVFCRKYEQDLLGYELKKWWYKYQIIEKEVNR